MGSANDERSKLRQSLRSLASSSRHSSPPSFSTWDEVPDIPTAAHRLRPWFLEMFAGKAWLTRAMKKAGWSTLPPVEINVGGDTLASADLLDPALRRKIDTWIASGCVRLAHFGTPCTTFSRARKNDGGPPPLRTNEFLEGVPKLSAKDKEKVRLGTLFLDITLQFCEALTKVGALWSIENPESSLLWLMPQVKAFCQRLSPLRIELHMCAYSSLHCKPTSFLTSARCLALIGKLCPGKSATHVHEALSGTVVVDGKQIYKTKLAQVYPHQLCEAYALAASSVLTTEFAAVEADELMPSELAESPLVQSQVCDVLQAVSVDPFGLGSSDLDGSQFKDTFL